MQANKQASKQLKQVQTDASCHGGFVPSMFYIFYESNTAFTLQYSGPNRAELNHAGPTVLNDAGLVWPSSLQLSFMTVYTVKQTGLSG